MSVIKKIGDPFFALAFIGDHLQSIYLLAIRLLWGALFYYTGMGKLNDIEGTASFFTSIELPFPYINAYVVGLFEYVGGACLCLGIATRLMCLPLITIMIVALYTAHHAATLQIWDNPGIVLNETPTSFLIVLLTLFVFGPGKLSIDNYFSYLAAKKF